MKIRASVRLKAAGWPKEAGPAVPARVPRYRAARGHPMGSGA